MAKKAKPVEVPALPEDLRRAIVLAKSLKGLSDIYLELDAVFFNPHGFLELQDEIRDKIVDLLCGVDLP
jgi:hypothetical protein